MKKCGLFLLGIVLCHFTFCQNTIGLPRIINYDNNNFHAGAQTWDIRQAKDGTMYFGNSAGLLTFDGSHWALYPLPNKTIIRSLYIDNDDRIYAGGQDEFGYFFPDKNGSLVYHSLKDIIPAPQKNFADIWDIEPFGDALFFRATDRIFELKNDEIKVYTSNSEWRFLKATGNKLLAQDKAEGLLEYSDNEWKPFCKEPFDKYLVSGIIPSGRDTLLVSTLKNGLFKIYNGKSFPVKTEADADFMKDHIYALSEINNSEYVAGTTSNGCIFMNKSDAIVQKITRSEDLQNSNVLCLFRDNNNNLWAGLNNGISFIAYNSAIKYIQPNKSNDLSGFSTVIFNNKLYIATSDGAYTTNLSYKNNDLSFSKGTFTQIKNSSGQVWRIDNVNQQLLMGYNDGAFLINGDEAFPIMQGEGAWIFKPVTPVFPSSEILAGTYTGIQLINFSNNKFTDAGKIKGVYESLRLLEYDDNNDVWWSSHPYRGIYKIRLSKDHKSCNAQLLTAKDGLPSALSNYVFKIKNRIVFATEKGVYEYDASKGKFIPSSYFAPIFGHKEIQYLNEDASGNIWFSTRSQVGVVNFEKKTKENPFTITYFPELTDEILAGSENIYPFNNENIFIGAQKGVIHINLEKYTSKKPELRVLLTRVKSIGDGKDSLVFGGYFRHLSNKSYAQDKNEIHHLSNKYNSFHFEYSSPSYGLQKNIEYSYQLKGYDYQWSDWSSKTEKDYTNLPKGKYTFYIKAHDNLGHESPVVSYDFYVDPSWYNTIWAYVLYGIMFILLLYILYKMQERKLYRQQLKFDLEQKRLKELHQLKLDKSEKEIIKLQNEKLAREVRFKSKELADAAIHLEERNNALMKVKGELERLYKRSGNNHDIKKTLLLLKNVEKNNSNWEQFASHFDEVNNDFLKKIKDKYPALSNTDIKVCTYLKLNLSTKEIAQLMNISIRGVEISRYRLRKKLEIPKGQSLNDFLNKVVG